MIITFDITKRQNPTNPFSTVLCRVVKHHIADPLFQRRRPAAALGDAHSFPIFKNLKS